MRPRFHARLINGPLGDPVLYCNFIFENRAIVFDLGDLSRLSPKDLLRVSHVFVSHTHMDHFCGFDTMLRVLLGRGKTLYLFGPPGFHANVRGKLSSYNWNLIHTYKNPLTLTVTEVHEDHLDHQELSSQNRFHPPFRQFRSPFDGRLVVEPSLEIRSVFLDHGTPCLGFSLKERFHVNIMKARLDDLGLPTGSWLQTLKQAVFEGAPAGEKIAVPLSSGGDRTRFFTVGELVEKVVRISPGQSIAYITDVGFTPVNVENIAFLAAKVDHLFIEAAFLDQDRQTAAAKRHLTAAQAGHIAALSDAQAMTVFHFSPRYELREQELTVEAETAFRLGGKKVDSEETEN